MLDVEVLCIGHAAWDITCSVARHPGPDEKVSANALVESGGGPAANAAVAAARLGCRSAFAGYLGNDRFGDLHLAELHAEGVCPDLMVRGTSPTPLSCIVVKPGGLRTVINHSAATGKLARDAVDFSRCRTRVLLCDGHEPHLSPGAAQQARADGIPLVLDAGSVHAGTVLLAPLADYLIASEKFALQYTAAEDPARAARLLGNLAPHVVVTLGSRGLVWHAGAANGCLAAFPVMAIDTTGAGDAFHGAFAAGLSMRMPWPELLRFASAAGALACTALGTRASLPRLQEVRQLLNGFAP